MKVWSFSTSTIELDPLQMLLRRIPAVRPLARALRGTALRVNLTQIRCASQAEIDDDPNMVSYCSNPDLRAILTRFNRMAATSIHLPKSANSAIHMPTGGTNKSGETMASQFMKIMISSACFLWRNTRISEPDIHSSCWVASSPRR